MSSVARATCSRSLPPSPPPPFIPLSHLEIHELCRKRHLLQPLHKAIQRRARLAQPPSTLHHPARAGGVVPERGRSGLGLGDRQAGAQGRQAGHLSGGSGRAGGIDRAECQREEQRKPQASAHTCPPARPPARARATSCLPVQDWQRSRTSVASLTRSSRSASLLRMLPGVRSASAGAAVLALARQHSRERGDGAAWEGLQDPPEAQRFDSVGRSATNLLDGRNARSDTNWARRKMAHAADMARA